MSDLVRSEVEAALESIGPLIEPIDGVPYGVMVSADSPIVAAARAWLAEGDATPEAGSLSTPTEPTEPDYEAGWHVLADVCQDYQIPLLPTEVSRAIVDAALASRAEETP